MNILLDLDGTLTDPYDGIAASIHHAMAALGEPLPPDIDLGPCIGPPLDRSFAAFLETDDEVRIQAAIDAYREHFPDVMTSGNRLYDGVHDVMQALTDDGHQLFLATSKPLVYAVEIIDHFGLTPMFEGLYGSELNGERSDKADLIAYLLLAEDLAPDETLMVGDREHDVAGAFAAGVSCAGVLWGYGSREELLNAGADWLLEHPAELAELDWLYES
ncbi:MAG: HAD hydrolase-like protein [Pseudomonadota bacterium]